MRRTIVIVIAVAILASVSALAHHGYANFFLDQTASVEGRIETLLWASPHVVLTIRTDEAGTYTAMWDSPSSLMRKGVRSNTFAAGDRVIVSGSPSRDAKAHMLAVLSKVERPGDGFTWEKLRPLVQQTSR